MNQIGIKIIAIYAMLFFSYSSCSQVTLKLPSKANLYIDFGLGLNMFYQNLGGHLTIGAGVEKSNKIIKIGHRRMGKLGSISSLIDPLGGDSPTENLVINEMEGGYSFKAKENLVVNLFAGVGHLSGVKRGKLISSGGGFISFSGETYETIKISTYAIPLKIDFGIIKKHETYTFGINQYFIPNMSSTNFTFKVIKYIPLKKDNK
ncbi:MAG: hypothetical protein ACJAZ3_002093 [Sphingobacteriales bacterium]|jgi:hypothetical protein